MMNPTSPVRLAIMGAGVMGANHARVASRTAGVELVAIVDVDVDRRSRLAASTGTASAGSLGEVADAVDAVVIAAPTSFHHRLALEAIEAGLHVLVEKPIAVTPDEGRDIERHAIQAGVVLTVGHVERFNPAVRELLRDPGRPVHIELQRVGPFTPRVADNVVVDLMIHDLDLARALARSEVTRLSAITRATKTDGPDMAVALLTFANGVTATVTASRIGQQKLRRISVNQDEAVIVGDLIRQDVMIHRMQHVEFVSEQGARIRQSGMVEIPFIENRGEPLMEELRAFVDAIHGAPPVVTAADGIAALELALQVLEAGTAG